MNKILIISTLCLILCGCGDSDVGIKVNSDVTASWVKIVDHAEFSPRDTVESVVFKNKIWLSNGYPDYRDLWTSDDGLHWTQVLDSTPYEKYSRMIVYKDNLWAITRNSVWTSENGISWVKVLDKTPFYQKYGDVVVFNNKLWYLGAGSDVWWSTDGIEWVCATQNAPYGDRAASAVAVYAGRLWVMGGSTPAPGKGYPTTDNKGYPDIDMNNDVWSSTDGQNWKKVTDHAPWKGRMWFKAKVYLDRIWIMGGYDNDTYTNYTDSWYTTDGVNWKQLKSQNQWSARHQPTIAVFNNSLYLISGNSWPLMNDVWKLEVNQ